MQWIAFSVYLKLIIPQGSFLDCAVPHPAFDGCLIELLLNAEILCLKTCIHFLKDLMNVWDVHGSS